MAESSKRAWPDFLDPFPIEEYELFSKEPLGTGTYGSVYLFRKKEVGGRADLHEFVAVKDIAHRGNMHAGLRNREITIMKVHTKVKTYIFPSDSILLSKKLFNLQINYLIKLKTFLLHSSGNCSRQCSETLWQVR